MHNNESTHCLFERIPSFVIYLSEKLPDDAKKSDDEFLCTINFDDTMSQVCQINQRTEHTRGNELCFEEGDGGKQNRYVYQRLYYIR